MALAAAIDLRNPRDAVAEPPASVEAEQALLGAILYDNTAYEALGDKLKGAHFFEPFHGRLFEAIEARVQRGQIADPTTLSPRFTNDDAFKEFGGIAYLALLVDRAPPAVTARDYGAEIYDLALRRELIRVGGVIAHEAQQDRERAAAEQVEAAEQSLFAIAQQGAGQTGFQPLSVFNVRAVEMAAEAYSRDGGLSGITTGLADLDKQLGGLHASDLIILAARPSMGKSALALNIGRAAARRGVPTGFSSLEMSGEQLSLRLIAELSGVPGDKIRRGDISAGEFGQVRDAATELDGLPLHIDATGGVSIAKLVTRARRLKRLHNIGLLIVDYLQLITTAGKRDGNRTQEVTEITQALKAIAKDLDIPVLALSQLSRNVENREDKHPQLSDLRESGSIEQDADVVMFIYREAYYLGRQEPAEGSPEFVEWSEKMDRVRNLAEIVVGKQRHGPIGTVKLHFDDELTRFSDRAREDHYQPRQPYRDD